MTDLPQGLLDVPQLAVGARSDVGRKRTINEDALMARFPVYVVADGMGGHEAGDLASAAVVHEFARFADRDDVNPDEVVEAVAAAHRAVGSLAQNTARAAGSTVTGLTIVRQAGSYVWMILNLGDSRVYRLYDNTLEQLTVDHSIAQEMVEQGELRKEDMASFPGRNVITRAVGADAGDADYWLAPIVTGERLLVCSDGLTGEVSDEALLASLTMTGAPQDTADRLIALAVENGGRDNVTAIVVDVLTGGVDPALDQETSLQWMNSSAVILVDPDVEGTTVQSRRGRHA